MKVTGIYSHGFTGLDVRLMHENPNDTIVASDNKVMEDGDILFYNKHYDGTYTYGIIQGNRECMGHSQGYIWSSRPSVINMVFGLDLIAVGVNGKCCAIPVATLTPLLPNGFVIRKHTYNSGEEYYQVEL